MVLLTGVDTARAGPVVATVSQNVYDTVSGRHLVLPQGTRLIGRHEGESAYGDRRAFLTWDRLILPNGKSFPVHEPPPDLGALDGGGVPGVAEQAARTLAISVSGDLAEGGDRAGEQGSDQQGE